MKQATSHSEKKKFWQQQLHLAKKFPGSQKAFCKAQGLSIHTFLYWRKKLAIQSQQPKTVVTNPFVPVLMDDPQPVMQKGRRLPEAAWVAELILHLQAGLQR